MKEILDDDLVTIKVKKKTRHKLKENGIKGQTYDDIISELLEIKSLHK